MTGVDTFGQHPIYSHDRWYVLAQTAPDGWEAHRCRTFARISGDRARCEGYHGPVMTGSARQGER